MERSGFEDTNGKAVSIASCIFEENMSYVVSGDEELNIESLGIKGDQSMFLI